MYFQSFVVFTGVLVAGAALVAFIVYRLLLERHIPRTANAGITDPHGPTVNPETMIDRQSDFDLSSNDGADPTNPSSKEGQDPSLLQSQEFGVSSPSSLPSTSAPKFDKIDSNESEQSPDDGQRSSVPIEVPALAAATLGHKHEPQVAEDLTTSEAPAPFPEESNITKGTTIPTDITAVTSVASPTEIATPVIVIAAPKRKRAPRTKRLPSASPATSGSVPRRRRSSSKSKSSGLVSAVSGSGFAADSPPSAPLTEASGSVSHTEDGAGSTETVTTAVVAENESKQQTQI